MNGSTSNGGVNGTANGRTNGHSNGSGGGAGVETPSSENDLPASTASKSSHMP